MSSISAASKLFKPFRLGNIELKHRVVLAPLTRFRANNTHVHGDLAVEYYSQRASTPGTLLITEATLIAPEAGGYDNVPGIWSDAQIAGWKRVTNAVHAKGSYIILQLWALGRAANPAVIKRDGFEQVSASDIPLEQYRESGTIPRPLTKAEISTYVEKFAQAAKNAVAAGFDGVEIHNANGYLLDQFIQDVTNKRNDEYGGSIENRSRFALETIDAVVSAVGAERTSMRLSPWGQFQEMGMKDPIPTYSYLIEQIVQKHPNLLYLHFVEARVAGDLDSNDQPVNEEHPSDASGDKAVVQSNEFARKIWGNRPYISAGAYSNALERAAELADRSDNVLVAFGRAFIANPDLPLRLKNGIALNKYDRQTFYTPETAIGYTDQPFAEQLKQ